MIIMMEMDEALAVRQKQAGNEIQVVPVIETSSEEMGTLNLLIVRFEMIMTMITEMDETPVVKLKLGGSEILTAQATVILYEVMEFSIPENNEMMEIPMTMMDEAHYVLWKQDGHDLVHIQQLELSTDLMG